jgi:hypothetical protein
VRRFELFVVFSPMMVAALFYYFRFLTLFILSFERSTPHNVEYCKQKQIVLSFRFQYKNTISTKIQDYITSFLQNKNGVEHPRAFRGADAA